MPLCRGGSQAIKCDDHWHAIAVLIITYEDGEERIPELPDNQFLGLPFKFPTEDEAHEAGFHVAKAMAADMGWDTNTAYEINLN